MGMYFHVPGLALPHRCKHQRYRERIHVQAPARLQLAVFFYYLLLHVQVLSILDDISVQ